MIKIGLTGSIGMGKSTTAQMFAAEGVPVWDADAAVGRLYKKDGLAVAAITGIAPDAIDKNGVNRNALKALINEDPTFLVRLEAIVHPLVAQDREAFFKLNSNEPIVLLDIPLLYENGTEENMNFVVVVSAPATIQKERVLERGTMNEDTFNLILAKQMPDKEKRARADFVIETTSIEHARNQVQNVLAAIRSK